MDAAKIYELAAQRAADEMAKEQLLAKAAEQYAQGGEVGRADAIVDMLKTKSIGNEKELTLLPTLRKIAEVTQNDKMLVAVLERIVELTPTEVDKRFSLAYQHSQLGNEEVAMFHYLKIPYQDRTAMAWNNLGVVCDALGMPAKSVDAYRTADGMGETLAMSNIGYKLLSVGFIKDALSECEKALETKDYHQNVGSLLARLKELPEEEDEKEKEVLANAKPKIEFYKSLGKAICHRQPGEVAEQWKGPDCVLTVKLTGKAFRMSGRYERQANPLSSAFGVMLASPVKTVTYEITYEGRLEGHVINAEVVRSSDRPKSLLDSSEIKTQVIMVLSDDLKSIAVMENPHSSSPSFYSMTALLTDATR